MTRPADPLREITTPTSGLPSAAEIDRQTAGHALFTRSLLDAPERPGDVRVGGAADTFKRGS